MFDMVYLGKDFPDEYAGSKYTRKIGRKLEKDFQPHSWKFFHGMISRRKIWRMKVTVGFR